MNTIFALMGMGGGEMIIVFGAILLLFGAKRIPEFAKGLGQGIKEFKKASSDVTNEFHTAMSQETPPPAARKDMDVASAGKKAAAADSAALNPSDTVPKA